MNMTNNEKIYVTTIVVLSIIIFYLKNKKAPQKECICPSKESNYVPVYVPSPVVAPVSTPTVSNTVSNNPILQEALVYTGPLKFKIPEQNATDERGILYYQENNKFYKIRYVPETYISTFTPQEITKQEMITAWKSINP